LRIAAERENCHGDVLIVSLRSSQVWNETRRRAPINAAEPERDTFGATHDGMRHGWTGTFDQLAEYLARVKV